MKKQIILLAAFLITGVAVKAQVGVGTDDPKSTLEIVGETTSTVADGVLVPRFTVTELSVKDGAYGADQNGALVFVTSGVGSAGKTSEITGPGFHYYDNATSKWIAVGGGGSSAPAVYQNILGESVMVNAASYNALPTDYLIRTTFSSSVSVTLPNADASNKGKMYVVYNNNTAASTVTVVSNSVLGTSTMSINRGKFFVSDGANWVGVTYN
ncbi:hypothetical protein [Moheibacter sediminis]|uniref:Uncharacterized protein n=1 Tax=Moheibacter sediminis TaxID=1434700 RepID=A0A1W2AQV2_9FLAO|nr:hypothetical protein [Moheibacter sediminis]SMC63096.1 hypothetical protein SAMN06296427_10516 [Moheibacter sediminis]